MRSSPSTRRGRRRSYRTKEQTIFLIGNYPTYTDFVFFEMVELLRVVTERAIMKEHLALASYQRRMMGLKGLKEYLVDSNCHDAKLIFNNAVAKIDGNKDFDNN